MADLTHMAYAQHPLTLVSERIAKQSLVVGGEVSGKLFKLSFDAVRQVDKWGIRQVLLLELNRQSSIMSHLVLDAIERDELMGTRTDQDSGLIIQLVVDLRAID